MIRILNYACLKVSWLFMHWFANLICFENVDRTLNDNIFIESYMFCRQIVVMNFNNILWNFLRLSYCEYTVHALFSDSLLCYSRKTSSFQFLLHWNDNLSCNLWRDVCCKFLIHIRMFRFCQNILQRYYILHFLTCSHVKIWRDVVWRMFRNSTFFVYLNSNEMFWQSICISFSTCCITRKIYFKFWRDVLFVCNWRMSRNLI